MQITHRTTKQCSRCGKWKSKTEFEKQSNHKDGLKSFCRKCHSNYNSSWARNHRNYVNDTMKRYREKLRLEVLTHYGGNPPKCACCGEMIIQFLTLDHINGGGHKERLKYGMGSFGLYIHLRKTGFPEGYQVFCMSCNFGKRMNNGICPHKTIKHFDVDEAERIYGIETELKISE